MKLKKAFGLIWAIFLMITCSFTQTVETVVPFNIRIADGIYVDDDGIIYTGAGGLVNQTTIGRVTPDGQVTAVASGMRGSIDIEKADNGLFYVTNYDDNTVKTYDSSTETVTTVVTGLDGPAGITKDTAGNFYVTNWGAWPNYSGHEVHKISPDHTVEVLVSSDEFYRLQGIAMDDNGWLYISNSQNGRVFKVDPETGAFETFASIGTNIINMVFHEGHFYICAGQTNRILIMDLEGNFSTYSGTGVQGGQDGPVDQATYYRPIGIDFTASGDTIYVSEGQPHRLRRIILNDNTVNVFAAPQIQPLKLYPNPNSGLFRVEIPKDIGGDGTLTILDSGGKEVFTTTTNKNTEDLQLENLQEGIYFVHFVTKHGMRGGKLVISGE